MKTFQPLLIGVSLAAAGTALAADTNGNWNGSADVGFTNIAGNSNSSSLLAATRMTRTDGRYKHNLEARAKNTEESGLRTAEAYRVSGKEDVSFSARDYLYVGTAWDKDRVSGYDWQLSASIGYGRKLIDTERHRLSLEVGPGYRHDELPGGGSDETATAHAAAKYEWEVTDNTRFLQVLEGDRGEDNAVTRSLSELAIKLNSHLAFKASLEVKRNSEPPVGTKNSDRTTMLALAWTF